MTDRSSRVLREMRLERDFPKMDTASAFWLVSVVAIAFLGSIAGIQYATLDDRWYAAWAWNGSWARSAYDLAVEHGRLLKASDYTRFFPYLFESHFVGQVFRLGTIFLAVWVFGVLMQRIWRGHGIVLLFVTLFFAFAQNSFDHNLLVAYPFAWELSWLTLLIGFVALMLAVKRQRMWYALVGSLIWLSNLQEAFVPYAIFFALVVYVMGRDSERSWRYLVPYVVGGALWLTAWLAWRIAYPSHYDGAKLDLSSPLLVLRGVVNYSVGGIPLSNILNGISVREALSELGALALVKGVAAFAVTYKLLIPASLSSRMKAGSAILMLAVLSAMVFLPNVQIAMTPKYQEWMLLGAKAYLYSHFSYFAWVGLILLALLLLIRRWPSTSLSAVIASLVAFCSVIADGANARVNREQEQISRRWATMENFFRSAEYRALPEGAAIWMRDSTLSSSVDGDATYWSFVARARTGKSIVFSPDLDAISKASSRGYYLYLYDEPETANQYVLFAEFVREGERLESRKIHIYPNSPNRRIAFTGLLTCEFLPCIGTASIGEASSAGIFADMVWIEGMPHPDATGVYHLEIQIHGAIDVRKSKVDFARNPVDPGAAVSVRAANGFHGWESDAHARWNWADVESILEVSNALDRSIKVELEFWVVPGDARKIEVYDSDGRLLVEKQVDVGSPALFRIPMRLAQGKFELRLRTDKPALHVSGPERGLAYQVRDIGLRVAHE